METIEQNKLLKIDNPEATPRIHEIYFNGFSMAIGAGDIILKIMRGSNELSQLNCSYTVAKTLSQNLVRLIETLEQKTENRIMTMEEISAALSKGADNENQQ